eukprot:m.447353 g.447353  ORF g.447353 m.447353 type:complete len:77 (-) comp20315_c3_seq2:172-402(-)
MLLVANSCCCCSPWLEVRLALSGQLSRPVAYPAFLQEMMSDQTVASAQPPQRRVGEVVVEVVVEVVQCGKRASNSF